MRKLYWLILILLIIGISYVVASKMSPAVDEWALANVLTPIHGGLVGVYTAIITNATWVTYVAPNAWWVCGIAGVIGGVLLYRWHIIDKVKTIKVAPTSLGSKITLQREPAEPEQAPVQTSKIETPPQPEAQEVTQ